MFVQPQEQRTTGEAVDVTETGTVTGAALPLQASRIAAVRGFAPWPTPESPKDEGKALRARIRRRAHAELVVDTGRPDAVTAVEESNHGRLPELTPIRVGRMAATPFAFLRGSAGLMAYD
ncbi:DUF2252 family protein, partial [Streptomyces sp. NPDC001215]